MQHKILIANACIRGMRLILDEELDSPLFVFCIFSSSTISCRKKGMLEKACFSCIFDDTCEILLAEDDWKNSDFYKWAKFKTGKSQ